MNALLYRIEEAREAIKADRVLLCEEGEKDVDSLRRFSFAATCNPNGAMKPRKPSKWTAKLKRAARRR